MATLGSPWVCLTWCPALTSVSQVFPRRLGKGRRMGQVYSNTSSESSPRSQVFQLENFLSPNHHLCCKLTLVGSLPSVSPSLLKFPLMSSSEAVSHVTNGLLQFALNLHPCGEFLVFLKYLRERKESKCQIILYLSAPDAVRTVSCPQRTADGLCFPDPHPTWRQPFARSTSRGSHSKPPLISAAFLDLPI